MNTKWDGLWAQEREGFYAGRVIRKKDIPAYTRIVLRYNKFYKKGTNKPRFVYCFADSEGYESKCVPIEYEDSLQEKVDRLAEILREGHCAPCVLPSQSQARAQALFEEAIKVVEELTGEEWRFDYYY